MDPNQRALVPNKPTFVIIEMEHATISSTVSICRFISFTRSTDVYCSTFGFSCQLNLLETKMIKYHVPRWKKMIAANKVCPASPNHSRQQPIRRTFSYFLLLQLFSSETRFAWHVCFVIRENGDKEATE